MNFLVALYRGLRVIVIGWVEVAIFAWFQFWNWLMGGDEK